MIRILIFSLVLLACNSAQQPIKSPTPAATVATTAANAAIVPAQLDAAGNLIPVTRTDSEWKQILSDKEYNVLRQEGTEYSFSGDLWDHHEIGTYICRGCGLPLFASTTKFESGTGWPSFWQSIDKKYVKEIVDNSHGMSRTEVECARCGGHLGHVFDDGPKPTGLRYCMNSASLDFVKE